MRGSQKVPILRGISREHYAMHPSNPTFPWPVRCTPCSCRVCPGHGAHLAEKLPFLNGL